MESRRIGRLARKIARGTVESGAEPGRGHVVGVVAEKLNALKFGRATGDLPPFTTHHDRPGPFAQFVQACLDMVGADANAIELLHERQRRRQIKRLAHVVLRREKVLDQMILHLARRKIIEIITRLSHRNP